VTQQVERWGVPPYADSPWVAPGGPVRISPMRRRDLRAVLRIDAQQLPQEGWSVGLYLAELRRTGDRCYLVARVDGRVVGFGGVLFQHPDAHVTTLSVDTAARSRRVATRLMLELARRVVDAGVDNLTLEVRAGNVPAISLYRRFGLAPVGVRKGYYGDTGDDALVMWVTDLRGEAYRQRLDGIEARMEDPTIIEGRHP
jgi:[ribosomal protein S18]-alanine N-acetyltransferase